MFCICGGVVQVSNLNGKCVIRILRLEPSLISGSQLSGSFELASLDQVTEFAALSYVWGTELSEDRFKIEGGEIEIGANLDTVL